MYLTGLLNERVVLDCEQEGEHINDTLKNVKLSLDRNYVDKVIPNEGLCVAIHKLTKIEPMPILGPNDGRTCYRVTAQVLLFRPLPREIIVANVQASDPLGIRLSLGFFQDVRVPSHMLPQTAQYDEGVNLWKWIVDSGDRQSDLYFELGSRCRFRVVDVVFSKEKSKETVPMLVIGSMREAGTGVETWWT